MEVRTIFITYVVWLLFVRFLAGRGLGPFGSFARDMSTFMLGKGLGPAADLMEDRAGSGAKTWFAHGIFWFIIASTLTFLNIWSTYEPSALSSLGAIGYSPSVEQSTAAVHVVTAFGALSMTLIAAGFTIQSRLCNGRMANEATTALLAFVWSAVVAAGLILAHTDLIGSSDWFELPSIYYILLSLLALPLFANHLLTMAQSDSPVMIPQWFIVMGFAAFIWLGPVAMILLSGENHTLSWLLVKVLFGGWLFSQALGVAHFVVPSTLGVPLWSRSLAGLALFGTFLTFSPLGAEAVVPEMDHFMRAVVSILLSLSLLPIIASVVNITKTASGRVMESYGVKFTILGLILLIPVTLGSLFASISAFGGGNELAHIAGTLDSLAIWGVIGMIALGGAHLLFPEVSGRTLFSTCKTKLAFWFSTIGIIGYASSQFIVDYVNHSLSSSEVSSALEDAGVVAADTGGVEAFAAMMFYGIVLSGIFAAQNMLQGSFRGTLLSDSGPAAMGAPASMTITGSTSIRSLLAAGAGSDTVITMEGNSDSSGRISLANASNVVQEETEEDEVEDEVEEEEEEEDEEVVELPANLSGLLKSELVDLAKSIGISDSGTKADIIERLESQPMY